MDAKVRWAALRAKDLDEHGLAGVLRFNQAAEREIVLESKFFKRNAADVANAGRFRLAGSGLSSYDSLTREDHGQPNRGSDE